MACEEAASLRRGLDLWSASTTIRVRKSRLGGFTDDTKVLVQKLTGILTSELTRI
jgi:hypothetical protein